MNWWILKYVVLKLWLCLTISIANFNFRQGDEKAHIRNYVENVVPLYTDVDFRRMFRMNPSTHKAQMNYLQDLPELQPAGPGRRDPIPINSQILLTLWYLGGVDTIAKIADRFGMSESSVVLC